VSADELGLHAHEGAQFGSDVVVEVAEVDVVRKLEERRLLLGRGGRDGPRSPLLATLEPAALLAAATLPVTGSRGRTPVPVAVPV
jgi:hypothetical protein